METHQDPGATPSEHAQRDRIDRSIPCRSCQYDLMGLAIDGKCPECGAAVEDSLEQYLPGLEQEKVLEQFRSGLNVNATAWLMLAVLSVGCLGFPFLAILSRPVVLFMAFTAAARALSISQLHASRSLIPGELPVPVWQLVTLPACAVGAAVLYTIGLGPMMLLLSIFMVVTVVEGITWIEFIKRCSLKVECGFVESAALVGHLAWGVALLGSIISIVAFTGLLENDGLGLCLLVPSLIAWFTALIITGILTRSLADALPKLGLARSVEELTTEVVPIKSSPQVVKPVDDAPLPLADSTGTTIEIRDIEGLSPPDAANEKPD
jgi:hypothetical protein